jgi:hypothetical protein
MDEKSKSIEQAKASLTEAESGVLIDVNNRYRKLQQTRQQLRIAQLTQELLARKAARPPPTATRAEAALLSDVLQTQTSLADANQQVQEALVAFWTARADFEKAIGEDK